VERCAKNRKAYRVRHPKRYKGRKRGRKAPDFVDASP
jgi:hypothetical protein